jgi:anti-sigma factor RsiW
MTSCDRVLSRSTPYVDGELASAERAAIDRHLETCPACREAIDGERRGRALLVACRFRLRACASGSRRDRGRSGGAGSGRRRWTRLPLAATMTVACVGALGYGLVSRNSTAIAAQLALDHLKCARLVSGQMIPAQMGEGEGRAAERLAAATAAWEQRYGWRVTLPSDTAREQGFEFVTLRRCLHGQGYLAHALYRRGDHLVSLFVFPTSVQASGLLEIMGERASVWSNGAHTYAVIGTRGAAEIDQLSTLVRAM